MPRKQTIQKLKEKDIQHICVEWFRASHPDWIIFSCPNEAARTRFSVFEYSGALRGAPDIVVVMPSVVFFVEFKTRYGKQSDGQVAFEEKCKLLGVGYYVCRTLEDFKTVVAKNQPPMLLWNPKDAFSGCLTLTEVPKFYTQADI